MKKPSLIIQVAAFVLIFNACNNTPDKKSIQKINNKNAQEQTSSQHFSMPGNSNREMKRNYKDVINNDYEVAIIDNALRGGYSSSPGSAIMISGKTSPDDNISVVLNGTTYSARPDGQWLSSNILFKNYIGTRVIIQIKSGATQLMTDTIYVPKAHLAAPLTVTNGRISRTGNTLTWTSDPLNTSGYVLFNYRLADVNDNDLVINQMALKDNGSYLMDSLLTNSAAKKIYFQLISGNTASANTSSSKKILFSISTWDHHEYYIN